jgi:hypothetical protein
MVVWVPKAVGDHLQPVVISHGQGAPALPETRFSALHHVAVERGVGAHIVGAGVFCAYFNWPACISSCATRLVSDDAREGWWKISVAIPANHLKTMRGHLYEYRGSVRQHDHGAVFRPACEGRWTRCDQAVQRDHGHRTPYDNTGLGDQNFQRYFSGFGAAHAGHGDIKYAVRPRPRQ